MGPFFQYIGRALRKRGHHVWKINFNGGDELFWRMGGSFSFRSNYGAWPGFLGRILQQHKITDVILFGDCRELHRQAILICREMHIAVHVFEEGYIRPDWVTLELGGVNGNSSLPKDPQWYCKRARELPPAAPHHIVPSSFKRRALEGIAYNAATILTKWRFPYWTDYRPWPPLVEGIGWLKRLCRRKKAQKRSADLSQWLTSGPKPYMLLPLQLDADAQLRLHSSYSGVAEVITEVLVSFAKYAPLDMRLVIKEHPLDNGVQDWKALILRLAAAHGVSNRVDYMELGDIAQIVRYARGVITVNSTTGTLALAHGVPVLTLGQAIYDMEGLTDQGTLEHFWQNPEPPDAIVFAAFRRVLIDQCLIPGGFFSEEGLEKLTSSAVARLEQYADSHSREMS
ncbi:capsular biosynthesis protein [Acetobacteraceae bacterium ESL0709]|nr:capsular biosynthesis protein [Acetobacteraceae bacterium ESL0697]MDF7677124.1 capsular biosynthesis protein [Acetobacteraceae bacterium ESL0709]